MSWILILGGTSDIARATAHTFASEGYSVMLAARNADDLADDVQDLKIRYNVDAHALAFDAEDVAGHTAFADSLPVQPDGVLCAVGFMAQQKDAEASTELLLKTMMINATGCMNILGILANRFEERGNGFIIGISSVAGDRGRKANYIYGAAKAAFTAFLSGLRNRLAKKGVHVMTVKPGFVATKMTAGLPLPAKLTASPAEVAEDIFAALQKKRDVLYTKKKWRTIMFVIKHIPEKIFKRLSI